VCPIDLDNYFCPPLIKVLWNLDHVVATFYNRLSLHLTGGGEGFWCAGHCESLEDGVELTLRGWGAVLAECGVNLGMVGLLRTAVAFAFAAERIALPYITLTVLSISQLSEYHPNYCQYLYH
jgi:hypothetical protein